MLDIWALPPGLASVHTLSVHMMHFLERVDRDATNFKKLRHTAPLHWSDKWLGRFYGMDVESLLVLDTLS